MRVKISILALLLFFILGELYAGNACIIIRGAQKDAYVYNSIRGVGRMSFYSEHTSKEASLGIQTIMLPEEQCKDLFYLIIGDQTTWLRIAPDQTLTIDVRTTPWIYLGDQQDVNTYLNEWTRHTYLEHPNILVSMIENMMLEIENKEERGKAFVYDYYTPEYMAWIAQLQQQEVERLIGKHLLDQVFVQEQMKRIQYVVWEMQCMNASFMKEDLPSSAYDFLLDIHFTDSSMMKYPGFSEILNLFFKLSDNCNLIPYTLHDYLVRQAEYIQDPSIREYFILEKLNTLIYRDELYQVEEVFDSVRNYILTPEGRKTYQELQLTYQNKLKSEQCQMGQSIENFAFRDRQGHLINIDQFKGKYVFIDVWATWCGPCKYQLPFVRRLEERLNNPNIAFISISLDVNAQEKEWQDLLDNNQITGCCLITGDGFKHKMFKNHNINAIPRFLLVDPEGKLVMDKARVPSDRILELQIREILENYEKRQVQENEEFVAYKMKLEKEYKDQFAIYTDVKTINKKLTKILKAIYEQVLQDINQSTLSVQDKHELKGYYQGKLLQIIYGKSLFLKGIKDNTLIPHYKKGYEQPLLDLDLSLGIMEHDDSWLKLVDEWVNLQIDIGHIKIQNPYTYLADVVSIFADQNLQEAYILANLKRDMSLERFVGMRQVVESVRPFVQSYDGCQYLWEVLKEVEKFEVVYQDCAPGVDLSAFEFQNQYGETIRLGNFHGKYLFIDIWSTGCIPCIGEIPSMKRMEKSLKCEDITFVSISLDTDKAHWLEYLKKNQMKGIQLFCSDGLKNPFIKQLHLNGIPQFLILDKNSKLINNQTLRPSNRILEKQLLSYMGKVDN